MKIFRNEYGELRSGWAVTISMALYMVLSIIVLSGIILALIFTLIGWEYQTAATPLINVGGQLWIFLVAYLLFRIGYRRQVSQMGLSKEKWLSNFLGGILYGLIIFSIVVGGLLLTGTITFTGINPGFFKEFGFYLALSTFMAGPGEEMLCRGLLTFQMKTTRKKWAILIVPSVIFSLLHLANPGVTVLSLANIMLVGVLFGVLLMHTGSLWYCIGAHGMWNLAQGGLFGIKVSGIDTTGFLVSEMSGPEFLAGGEFGAEGSMIATIVLIAAILLSPVIFKNRKPIESGFSIEGHLPLLKYKKH